MKQLRVILLDTFILCAVSTALAILVNQAVSLMKGRSAKDDPLVAAIIQNNVKSLRKLIGPGSGATRQADDQGRTALMRAAYANISDAKLTTETDALREEMISLLIEHGALIDQLDRDGWSALMWASWSGLNKVAAKLLELGASHRIADRQGNSALIIAAQRGNAEIVRILLAKGADMTVTNKAGKSALEAARLGGKQYPDKKPQYDDVTSQLKPAPPAAAQQ